MPTGTLEVLGRVDVHQKFGLAGGEGDAPDVGAERLDQGSNAASIRIEELPNLVEAFGADAAGQDADPIVSGKFEAGHAVLVPDEQASEQAGLDEWKIARHHEVLPRDARVQQGLDRAERSAVRSQVVDALMPGNAMGITQEHHALAEGGEGVPRLLQHAPAVGQEHSRLRDPHAKASSAAEHGAGMGPGTIGRMGDHGEMVADGSSVICESG